MKDCESELQQSIEKGHVPEGTDARIYHQLFKALETEPAFRLPNSFAERVSALAAARVKRESFVSEYGWLIGGVVMLVVMMIVVIGLTGFTLNFGFLKGMGRFSGVLIFGAAFIAVLHWIDKKVIRAH